MPSGIHRESSDSHESLRALTECLRALTGTSGFHRTPPGVHERLRALTGGIFYAAGPLEAHLHDLRLARTTSVVHRCEVFATECLRALIVTSGFHRDSSETHEASLSILAV